MAETQKHVYPSIIAGVSNYTIKQALQCGPILFIVIYIEKSLPTDLAQSPLIESIQIYHYRNVKRAIFSFYSLDDFYSATNTSSLQAANFLFTSIDNMQTSH